MIQCSLGFQAILAHILPFPVAQFGPHGGLAASGARLARLNLRSGRKGVTDGLNSKKAVQTLFQKFSAFLEVKLLKYFLFFP
jgi:hypothetical protein